MTTETVESTIHEPTTRSQIVVPEVHHTSKSEDSREKDTQHVTASEPINKLTLNPTTDLEELPAQFLGRPTHNLQVDDFELIKTLGTGT